MDWATRGLASTYWNDPFNWRGPWHRPTRRSDPRYFPERGGGRRMRHPFLDPIVYPRNPDRTVNFGYDVLRKVPSTLVKTLDSSVLAKFPQAKEDVLLSEIWLAQTASTLTELFHQFHRYWVDILPPGRYLGWQPRDLTWKNYFIELVDVQCGPPDQFIVEELGSERPWLMREQLTVSFKLLRDLHAPAGVVVGVGL